MDLTPRAHVTGFVLCATALVAAFSKPLLALAGDAAHSDLDSYIFLVPFVSGYLIYIRRNRLPKRYTSAPGRVIISLALGTSALALAWMGKATLTGNNYLTIATLAFLAFVVSAGFLFLGRAWMQAAAFPVFFLIFLIPMPGGMVDALETGSKFASAEAASLFFDASGTPVLRDGLIFQLPNITIQVAQECSGIRSSWVLFVTSLLAANLFLKSNWRRAALVGFVIPLGIIRNGFRVFVIGTVCIHYGPQMIHSLIHRRGGPLFFAMALVPLFLLLFCLRRWEFKRERVESGWRKREVDIRPDVSPH
jgi:exosortase C (VPDSG-CTERM-specific)